MRGSSLRHGRFMSLGSVLVCLVGTQLALLSQSHAETGRVLTPVEMSAIFGDDPGPGQGVPLCWERYTCDGAKRETTFQHGGQTYTCVYCVSSSSVDVCCPSSDPTDACTYNGAPACFEAPKFFALRVGTPDSCGIYANCVSPLAYGKCVSFADAEGDQCD